MKKRNLIVCVIALVLIATLGIGATLAYLTDNDTAKNTFTVGKVEIDLVEPDWNPDDAQDIEPGDVIDKDPAVVNTGKNSAYMMIKVEGMNEMRTNAFEVYFDDDNWVLVDENGKTLDISMVTEDKSLTGKEEAQLVNGYYVYVGGADEEKGIVKATESTLPLFEKVYYTTAGTGSEFETYMVMGMLNQEKNGVSHYEIWQKATVEENDTNSFDTREAAEAYVEANYPNADLKVERDDTSKKYVIWEKSTWAAEKDQENNFASYDAAADFIVSADGLDAAEETTYTFDLDLTAYSIQSENVEFVTEEDGKDIYSWVKIVIDAEKSE